MAIELISEITPKNNGDFPMVDSDYIRGGCHQAETYDDMLAIPTSRLKDSTLCLVTTPTRVLYIYDEASNTWTPFSSGGGGGGSDWLCVEDGETTKLVKDIDTWTQKITVINHIRTYADYFALPTEYVQNNEVAYCKADVMEGTTTYKKGLYSYDVTKASWVEVNSTIEIDSALSEASKRPVQNRVVTKALEEKVSKDDVDNVISRYSENPIQNKAVATALENIKNSKTMTAEEYDVLDDETKNDGSFYYISDTGEIYQNGIIYGGKQVFDVTQEEYDALTDEEKANNEYHCTDTGRVYINGILYGDKKPIELTFEEYKALEAAGEVEPDVDYVIVSDEKGILLASEDVGYKDKTVHEALVTLESDVTTLETDVTTKQENIYKKHIASRNGDASDTKLYCLIATIKLSNLTFINEPIIIEGVMGGASCSIQKMLFKASFDFRNGAKETAKVIYGYVNQSLFNYIDLLATLDESAEIAYIYVHHKTNYSMIDADISIPQRNASMYLTIPETFEKTDTIIGTEVHRMSTSANVKVLAGLDDTTSSTASTYSSAKIDTELNKKLHTYSYQWYGSHNRYVKLGSVPISTGSVSIGSLLVTLFASSTKLEEYPIGTINLNISSGASANAFNINGFSTIALNIPRADNYYTPRIVVDKTSTHYVLYIDCSYNYLKVNCSILNSTNFTFGDFETASDLEGTEVWSSVTSDDIKYVGDLAKLDDSSNSETSTWSSSKIASEINPTIDTSKIFSDGTLNISTLCNTYGNGRYVIVGQGTAGNGSATIDIWTLTSNAISYIVNVTYSNRTSNMFIGYTYDNPTINFETGYLNYCNHIAKVCTLA